MYEKQLELPGSFDNGVAVVSSAMNNIRWGNSVAADVVTFIRSGNASAATTGSVALILVALIAQFFH